MPQEYKAVREGQRTGEREVGGVAEIRIAVLGAHPPIVGDGIFDAPACGPGGAGVREGRIGSRNAGEEARRIDNGGVEAGERDAAGAINQGTVEGHANAAADRALDIALIGGRYAARSVAKDVIHGHRKGMAETRAVDGTFDSEHQPLVVLEIVTDMGAGDHPLGSVAKRACCELIVVRYPGPGNGVVAPGVTDLATNIDA